MAVRRGIGATWLAGVAWLAVASTAQAQVGQTVAAFDRGPLVTTGRVAYLEPFSLKNHTVNGVTYRATKAYHKACQIMLVVQDGKIRSEIFAIPIVMENAVLKAERELLDSFLAQSGLPEDTHAQVRQQMVDSMDQGQVVKQVGGMAVQTLVIPGEQPLLVVAIAQDVGSLPLPRKKVEGETVQ